MATPERRAETSETNRTLIIVVAIGSAVLIAIFFYVLMRASSGGGGGEPRLENAIREGSPQFEEYKSKIHRDEPEATEAKRALGDTVMTLTTTVRNLTGKTLAGLEIHAAVVDYEGKPIKQRNVVVVPTRQQPELLPNKQMQVNVMLDGFKDTDPRANITMEVAAFKFKE
ncbi:MAG TPA: hypothetical protein VJ656_07210 [Pyrinomonadaceae bacterium]|nr:hypothetical protein [Pyrinomonadaceae bacterium]